MDLPDSALSVRTRRAFLTAAFGGLGAWIVTALSGRGFVHAADLDPVLVGSDLSGAHTTKITVTTASSAAIWGNSSPGFGTGVGVRGDVATSNAAGSGIWGNATGGGAGVRGEAVSGLGVVGRSVSNFGVQGSSSSSTGVLGIGPVGIAGTSLPMSGIGGAFDGATAQLRLIPKGSQGKPVTGTHQKGEIYMDSKASLFICSAGGTPGTWKKVTAKLV